MTAPLPPPNPAPLDPELVALLEKPHFPADPAFPKENYLQAFGRGAFQQLLIRSNQSDAVARIAPTTVTAQMVMFMASPFGFWAIDLDVRSEQGVLGRDEFIGRVRDPIRRPPAQLASVVCEQHIQARGVTKIQVADGPGIPERYQVCSLKTIGWYAAVLMLPQPSP